MKKHDHDAEDAAKRMAASMWYERFEKPRQNRMTPRTQRLVRASLLLSAVLMVVLGVTLRGRKMDQVTGITESGESSALLTRELALGPEDARLFWPILQAYQDEARQLMIDRKRLLLRLDKVSDERNERNGNLSLISEELQQQEETVLAKRLQMLQTVSMDLGLWRSARLLVIQGQWDPWDPGLLTRPVE